MHVSFVLPLDQTVTESFFDTPRNKILKYGQTSDIQSIKIYAEANKPKEIDTSTEYQPVNIRITNANQAIVEALQQNTDDPAQVVETMKEKVRLLLAWHKLTTNLDAEATQEELHQIQGRRA